MKKRNVLGMIVAIALVAAMLASCSSATTETDQTTAEGTVEAGSETAEVVDSSGGDIQNIKIGDYTFAIDTSIPIEERTIGCVIPNLSAEYGVFIKTGEEACADETGIQLNIQGGSDWGGETTIDIMENFIAQQVDGITLMVMDVESATPLIQEANESGIPTMTNNSDAPDSGRLAFVGSDFVDGGELMGNDIFSRVTETYGGGLVLVSAPDLTAAPCIARREGVENALADYDNIELLFLDCPGDDAAIFSALENALLANPDIVGHISLGGTCTQFGNVLEEHDIGNNFGDAPIYSTGPDLFAEKLQQIIDGWQTTSHSQNPFDQGYYPIKMFSDFYTTYDPASFYEMATELIEVDVTNAQEYLDRYKAGEPIG